MEQFGSAPSSTARARRLRIYRRLANSFGPLVAVALLTIVLRWTFPPLLPALVVVWMPVAALLVVLAVPWLLVSWGFALGAIKCPSCGVAFAPRFTCGSRRTVGVVGMTSTPLAIGATSNNRWRGREAWVVA